ncbi:transposase [Frankia sp. KB5]|uniref:transposase n=1 Tax=Frankia sp. KB5 TaxID=683318 RepID=UPI0024114215|nr:transposase [Frankia sp. KB5]
MAVCPSVTDSEGFGKELLAAIPDLLSSMVKAFAEALMNAEVDEIFNANSGVVSPEKVNRRNGHRDRAWDTRAGTTELAVPGNWPKYCSRARHGPLRAGFRSGTEGRRCDRISVP